MRQHPLEAIIEGALGGGDIGLLLPRKQTHHRVVEGRQGVGRLPHTHQCAVFTERHIAAVVQAVLDPPMPAHQGQQARGICNAVRDARDAIAHRGVRTPCSCDGAFELEDLGQIRPGAVALQHTARGQHPLFDAPMSFLQRARW